MHYLVKLNWEQKATAIAREFEFLAVDVKYLTLHSG